MRLYPFLNTVRARITLWNVGALALILLVLGAVVRFSVEHNLMSSVDENITSRARGSQRFWQGFFANARSGSMLPGGPGSMRRGIWPGSRSPSPPRERPPSKWQARMEEKSFDLYRHRLFSPMRDAPLDQGAFGSAALGLQVYTIVEIDRVRVRVVSAPIWSEGRVAGVVQVGYALDDVDQAVGNLNRTLLTLIPFGLFAAGTGGLFLTRRMLLPLRDISRAAGSIGASGLSQRLPVVGTDEFSQLAATFNDMLARLERSFEQQRRFAADASHELRTPLTVIKASTSLALGRRDLAEPHRKSLERIDSAAALMNGIIQDLLMLARSDAGQLQMNLRPVPVSDIAAAAVSCVQPPPGLSLRNPVGRSSLCVLADAAHLTRLLVNLLDNAIRHTPAEGFVVLDARAEGEQIVFTVQDNGTGIPEEHLPHLFERFYRVDASRTRDQGGTGLGLSICDSIARAHGGSLTIRSTPGKGTTVEAAFTAAGPEHGKSEAAEEAPLLGQV